MQRTVYLVTGPPGVGKTTTSKRLVESLERSAYLSGDAISHYPLNGRGKPWLCEDTLNLTWDNIVSSTKNLLRYDYDVVVDYIILPDRMQWFVEQMKDVDVKMVYTALLVDEMTIVYRDQLRAPEFQMGERSLILLEEFKYSGVDSRYVIDTSTHKLDELDAVVGWIRTNSDFIVKL
ncbi:AAA family ATPase [Paenibacillus arenosi]|uniref:AAA family ATPase n=1 Tax=Paenibacillus arenosi TaxID=2774142 RepID=A0ABR9AXZ9_9BACL|nr:AAA family ATPase [Paenibacillus arenosi]MBD8499018.1 AAA family ATPase [Paenibacillus arenosi]